jgi:lipid A 3-O-deacylase
MKCLQIILLVFMSMITINYGSFVLADDTTETTVPDRYGLAISFGQSYLPANDIGFYMVSGFGIFDYDRIWPHRAPDALRFKIELTLGLTSSDSNQFLVSSNIFALYELERLSTNTMKPFIEGGIGLIYTDFLVEGQGTRFNFNPQLGIGADWNLKGTPPFFTSLRLNHISNGGLHQNNQGINAVVLMMGWYF